MKAAIWTAYGPPEVIRPGEVETPTPKDDQVLIRVRASTVTAADCELRSFKVFSAFWLPLRLYIGISRPSRIRILGQELAGEIAGVGKDVSRFKEGDQVYGASDLHLSTNAEYICLPEKAMLAAKPPNISYEQAAAVPLGGPEALQYLQQANIQTGQRVLVIGAGGTIGTYGVELAKYFGAEVTGVDSEDKLEMIRSIGADQVIDYTREDFTKNGRTYDVIFDAPGKSSAARCEKSLAPRGRYFTANPGFSEQIRTAFELTTQPKQTAATYAERRNEGLDFLSTLLADGKINPVIDRRYPLEQTAEAHRYAETGRKKGNIVLTV